MLKCLRLLLKFDIADEVPAIVCTGLAWPCLRIETAIGD